MTDHWRLLGDVGGTNIRFGLVRDQRSGEACEIQEARSWPSDTFPDFEAALEQYLTTLGDRFHLSSTAVAAAGPAEPGAVALTNRNWIITKSALQRIIRPDIPVRLLNDLEAVAYALPFLPGGAIDWLDDVHPPAVLSGRQVAINVGTGFGSATIIRNRDDWICCPAESGHMQLAIRGNSELALLASLNLEEATVEDVLSGGGVRRLWYAMTSGDRNKYVAGAHCEAAFDLANTDTTTNEVRGQFSAFLARTAANLVLASAAWDGVLLCGSVALAWAQQADRDEFRRLFVGASKMHERLAKTPVGFIRHHCPAFVGLANVRITER